MRERTSEAVQERETVRDSRVQPIQKHGSKTGVWVGRLFGLIIIGLAIAIGLNAADVAAENEGWAFLHAATVPLGLGFLIMVAAEILDRMDEQLKHDAWLGHHD